MPIGLIVKTGRLGAISTPSTLDQSPANVASIPSGTLARTTYEQCVYVGQGNFVDRSRHHRRDQISFSGTLKFFFGGFKVLTTHPHKPHKIGAYVPR